MTAAELIAWRKGRGLSQAALAALLGISKSRLQDYERGSTRGRNTPAAIPRMLALALAELERQRQALQEA